jgi:hypothetical protein
MKITKGSKIKEMVEAMEVGHSFNKKEFVTSIWGRSDYYIDRSFDVMFNTAKKQMPHKEFKTEKGFIIRTK